MKINNFEIEKRGGFICVKRWAILKDNNLIRIYFKFKDAKNACLNNDFSKGLNKDIY